MTDFLTAALAYAARGWRVFPCAPGGKVPAVPRGVHEATTDEATIRAWWRDMPRANVGVACGASGLYVVDFDQDAPFRASLPPTYVVRTPRGGWHHYYVSAEELPNTASKLAPGVDTRGRGGYVVAPPSVTTGGGLYQIEEDPATLADLPAWIAEKVRERAVAVRTPLPAMSSRPPDTYGATALDNEATAVAAAPEGGRNHALNRAAFSLGTLVAGGFLDEGTVRARLLDAALAAGLEERESLKTIQSGVTSGMKHPRLVERREPAHHAPVVEVMDDDASPRPRDTTRDAEDAQLVADVADLGGACGSFLRWCLDTAEYPQPMLALGGLVALGGVIHARRFVCDRLTTTAYVVNLAASGDGKSHPQNCVEALLQATWGNLLGASDTASAQSTMAMVEEAAGCGNGTMLILDEYGPRLGTLLDPTGPMRELRAFLLVNATKGAGTYVAAKSLARGGKSTTIHAPALCLFGSSTPTTFHKALSSGAVSDGFLPRHIFFQGSSVKPMFRRPARGGPPVELVEHVKAVRHEHESWHTALTRSGRMYEPVEVPVADMAGTFDRYRHAVDQQQRDGTSDTPPEVLARQAEHASRVALILALLSSVPGAPVTVEPRHHALAVRIVERSARTLVEGLAEYAADSEHERLRKQVVSALRRHGGWMSHRDLLRAVSGGARLRDIAEVMERLTQEGTAELGTGAKGGAGLVRLATAQ